MSLGYNDTPIIPGSTYHVHDGDRPQPPIVTPGATPGAAPSDAKVLFDGTSMSGWKAGDGSAAQWKVENGYMEVVPGTGNIHSAAEFGDVQLHVEMAAPEVVKGDGQGRGNSGIFLMRQYEIQVLDCFQNPTYPDGTTGGIYGQYPPLANACLGPGKWSTYDIIWEAPRFHGETLLKPAFGSVTVNGTVIHHRKELQGPTMHRETTSYKPHANVGALELQDHGDLVRFRNIWYRELKGYDGATSL